MSVACISLVRHVFTLNMISQPGAVMARSASIVSFISRYSDSIHSSLVPS
jgi:hypothetical protein